MVDVTAPQEWERWSGEPDDAWLAFKSFRDQMLPRRSIRPGGAPTAKVSEWMRVYSWQSRVESYDRHVDSARVAGVTAVAGETAKARAARDMALLVDAHELVARELTFLLDASKATDRPGTIKAGELIKLMEMSVKLGRLVHNETTDNPGPGIDYSKLSVDELRALHELMKKAKGD